MAKATLPRDALPYTEEFGALKREYEQKHGPSSDPDFWRLLADIGKHGGLGTGRRKSAPRGVRLTDEERLEILRMLGDDLERCDLLPYTTRFDDLHRNFTEHTQRELSPHEFWRALSRVAKLSRKPSPVYESKLGSDLSPGLVQFLERTNPWWMARPAPRSRPFRRWAFRALKARLAAGIAPVVAIRGPRQVGKSTIQEQFIEELLLIRKVPPDRIMRVQFEELPDLGAMRFPVESVVRWFEANVLKQPINEVARRGEDVYLLFDELQNIRDWSPQLKALVDTTSAKVVVTGSSALRIAKGRDSLAGRMSLIELGPLRLSEIAGIRGLPRIEPFSTKIEDWQARDFWLSLSAHGEKNAAEVQRAFSFLSRLGGYPRCHDAEVDELGLLRQQIVDTAVTRTIEHDIQSRDVKLDQRFLREIFRLLCRYAGQSVRSRRLAEELSGLLDANVAEQRVEQACQFFADSMLIHRVPALEILQRKQVHAPKTCLCDNFLRNAVLQEHTPLDPEELVDRDEAVAGIAGHLVESVLGYYLCGIEGADLAWYPARGNEREVDFILTLGTRRIPIEVKYRRDVHHAGKGIDAFCAKPAHEAPFGLMVTQRTSGEFGNAIAIPAKYFLLAQ